MIRRGTLYPAMLDSTMGRQMEVGYSLTAAVSGIHNALNARSFKSNLLSEPFNHPGNQIQQFRTTGTGGANDVDRIVMGAALNRRRFAR